MTINQIAQTSSAKRRQNSFPVLVSSRRFSERWDDSRLQRQMGFQQAGSEKQKQNMRAKKYGHRKRRKSKTISEHWEIIECEIQYREGREEGYKSHISTLSFKLIRKDHKLWWEADLGPARLHGFGQLLHPSKPPFYIYKMGMINLITDLGTTDKEGEMKKRCKHLTKYCINMSVLSSCNTSVRHSF